MKRTGMEKFHGRWIRHLNGREGIAFVRCRICSARRRVISGRHLSKHGTDRETYMEEYRLSPDELIAKEFRVIQSSHKVYRPYGKNDWIRAMKKVYQKDGNVFARYLQDKYPHLYTQGVWLFGDWDNALRSAGFDPEKMRMHIAWNEEKIIGAIRATHGKHLPLYARYMLLNYKKVFSAALYQYGSWAKALVAAGVTEKPRAENRHGGRVKLLNDLGDALEERSKNEVPQALKDEAAHYFGSLENAIVALRKEANRRPGWTRRKIIAVLSQMHRSKKNLAHALVRRDQPALLSAARYYFGSWGKALFAAGIDPNLYFVSHTWRKTRVNDNR